MVVMDAGGGGAEPVSVAEAKAWCRIDRGDEDGLVAALLKASREAVERETGLVLVRRDFRMVLDAVPADRCVAVPRRPLVAVTGVTAIGADGAPRVFPVTAVKVSGERVVVAWEVAAASAEGIEIEFSAGFDAGAVPEALKLAVKQIVAASYELRGAVPAEMQPGVMPKAARELIAPFRERRL